MIQFEVPVGPTRSTSHAPRHCLHRGFAGSGQRGLTNTDMIKMQSARSHHVHNAKHMVRKRPPESMSNL
jgi:hypothetical protein